MMDTKHVSEVIHEQRLARLKQRQATLIRVLKLIGVHSALGGLIWSLWALPLFTRKVDFVRDQVLSVRDLEQLWLESYQAKSYWSFASLNLAQVKAHPMIKDVQVVAYAYSKWEVYVDEYDTLGLWPNQGVVLLENGTTAELNPTQRSLLQSLPWIEGYQDTQAQRALAKALLELDKSSLTFISEIQQASKSYDVNYALLQMSDGIQVETSLSTLSILNDYAQIKRALNPEHNCIIIDEITSVPYSFSCTP